MAGTHTRPRGPFDGYLTETAGGRWEVAVAGVVIDTFDEEETARSVLAEHAAARPRWKVAKDGTAQRIG